MGVWGRGSGQAIYNRLMSSSSPEDPQGHEGSLKVVDVILFPATVPLAIVLDVIRIFVDFAGEENVDAGLDADTHSFIIRVFRGQWPFKG